MSKLIPPGGRPVNRRLITVNRGFPQRARVVNLASGSPSWGSCVWKMSPPDLWLWRPVGLTFQRPRGLWGDSLFSKWSRRELVIWKVPQSHLLILESFKLFYPLNVSIGHDYFVMDEFFLMFIWNNYCCLSNLRLTISDWLTHYIWMAQMVKNLPAMQETSFPPRLGRYPGEWNGNLENSMDIGDWSIFSLSLHGK